MLKKQLATITILTTDRQSSSRELNQLLTDHGHHIAARLGVNVERMCVEHCTALMTIALEATSAEVLDLTKKLNKIKNVKAQACVMTNEK
jgi:metal-responsive CopG/Arc/MetJ family transcriptional regulator